MKYNGILVWLLVVWTSACKAQTDVPVANHSEFGLTTNGLVYSPHTMGKLRHIVDSLNLKHRVCELHPTYQSLYQGQAYYVHLAKNNLQEAYAALQQNITPEDFKAKFPNAKTDKDLLVISYEEERQVKGKSQPASVYYSIPFGEKGEYTIQLDKLVPPQKQEQGKGHWIVDYQPKRTYGEPYIEAFYFPVGLAQITLPSEYATMVQYADCMVDTTTQIYLKPAKRTGRYYQMKEPKTELAFLAYVHQQTKRPSIDYNSKLTEAQQEERWRAYQEWDSLRLEKVDQIAKTPRFHELLSQAVKDTSNLGATDDEFEEYVARYYSAKKALELKRNRIVVGGCSKDDSPRRHALSIAQLSAETVNWEIFLRAHLDIMNDRFERMSDGSYAWAARKTYLRELEELDINVHDLMLGISLRIDQANRNHYFGSLSRVGRALAETRQPHELE